ncbi:MMPL family transporter [Aeoliella mucimassa]|uniref:MMPL family protein n=1 Tax=Aeoliella mucimassa TaxID=2527972 RepID=A0A518ASC2_9BACT|nr:MMPL family transporter [Aeoliella mucimassa]QDU57619.1 MMPL family protein [Aeoliella mucimassa]
MDRPTFLDRSPLGIPNYLAIALVVALMVAIVPRGARKALESNTNNVEDWLPASYTESTELNWFRDQFGTEAFVLVTWDGCTLSDTTQLEALASRLRTEPLTPELAELAHVAPHPDRHMFTRVTTGPELIDQLTTAPAKLERSVAIARLEGAMIGPATGEDDGSRTTCLMAYLSPYSRASNPAMRKAIEHVVGIVTNDMKIEHERLHIGGPPVDNVAIDVEGERTLKTLAGLSGLVGLVLAYLCFRNLRLTGMVLFVAIVSAGASLAMVYYYGAVEVLGFGADTPRLGKIDAILMSMPAVVYVLALSGAIHLVNYYRDAVHEHGRRGAVERAVRMALMPCGVAAITTAIGLASLASSDILPIEKFGVFSAIGVMVTLGILLSMLPVALHRFAPPIESPKNGGGGTSLPTWARACTSFIGRHYALVTSACVLLMVGFAIGLPRIESSVKLIKLLDPQCDLVQDYTWLEHHLGNLVPMEVVVSVPQTQRRGVNDLPDVDGQHYAMTTFERLSMARRVSHQIEQLSPVSRVLSAATFSPEPLQSNSPSNRQTYAYIVSQAIDDSREELGEFLRWEKATSLEAPPHELWRMSARIAALDDIDYGEFVAELREAVQPVIDAYQVRNQLVEILSAQQIHVGTSRLCMVIPEEYSTTDAMLADVLQESMAMTGSRQARLWVTTPERMAESLAKTPDRLASQQAVFTLHQDLAEQLKAKQIDCTYLVPKTGDSVNQISATYTGVVPLVYKTQRELLVSLQESLVMATLLIALVLMVLLRSIGGGLAAMIPNLFPLVVVFGALGWFGIPVDIGIMMTASVALGVAVDDTIHFVSWFRRGLHRGLNRYDATMEAYERCATAMVQTTLIAGLGLAVFAFSTFTPTEQFGYLMVTILAAALVGDLILLPALLVGPIGALFPASGSAAEATELAIACDPADESGENDSTTVQQPEPPEQPRVVIPATEPEVVDPLPEVAEQIEAIQAIADGFDAADEEIREPESNLGPVSNSERGANSEPSINEPASPSEAPQGPHQSLSPANAALREKLRRFRRETPRD